MPANFYPFCSLFVLFFCGFLLVFTGVALPVCPSARGCSRCPQSCNQERGLPCAMTAFKAPKLLSALTLCSPSSCICIFCFSALSGLFLFPCVTPSDALSTMPFYLGSPGFGLFINPAQVRRASVALPALGRWESEMAEGSRLLAKKSDYWSADAFCSFWNQLICFQEDQLEKGRITERAVFVREALCWDNKSKVSPCLSP